MTAPSKRSYPPRELARLIEAVSVQRLREYVEALPASAGSRPAVMPANGGIAAVGGSDSPVSRAVGLGLDEPISAAELSRVEAFFVARGVEPRFDVCPLADASLHDLLRERGYRFDACLNILYRPISPTDARPQGKNGIEVIPITPDLHEVWLSTVAAGFAGVNPPPADTVALIRPNLESPSSRCFLALVEGQPAGGGAYLPAGPAAELGSAATHPDFRRRGVQSALIAARLAAAAAEGCTLVTLATMPGSGTQRNAERAGFGVAYTRISVVAAPRRA